MARGTVNTQQIREPPEDKLTIGKESVDLTHVAKLVGPQYPGGLEDNAYGPVRAYSLTPSVVGHLDHAGPSKLGDAGGALGKSIHDFKRAIHEPEIIVRAAKAADVAWAEAIGNAVRSSCKIPTNAMCS